MDDHESKRLLEVKRFSVIDAPEDGSSNRLAKMACRIFNVPISVISVVDHDRIFFRGRHGVDVTEIGTEPGLCVSAILEHVPYIVNDAPNDPRALANPLVCGPLGLRFYAGAQLKTSSGFNLGMMAIADSLPRAITDTEIEILTDLADIVVREMELRLEARQVAELMAG